MLLGNRDHTNVFFNRPAPIQTFYFIGPYNLHYLLFLGIGTLLLPSVLFSQPITNLLWKSCRLALFLPYVTMYDLVTYHE